MNTVRVPRLRTQLIRSYVVLLVVSLGAMTLAFGLFLRSRPAPPEPVYQRLSALLQGFNARADLDELTLNQGQLAEAIVSTLDNFADNNDVRVLLVTQREQAQQGEGQRVLYDSAGVYGWRDSLPRPETVAYPSPQLERSLGRRGQTTFGRFDDGEQVWLFGGFGRETMGFRQQGVTMTVLLAEPAPTAGLQAVFAQFSSSLFVPLVQASAIGLAVAVILAWLISRGIVRPLQALARGAQAVAEGDYSYQVPEKGAREMRVVAHAFNEMSANVRASQQAQRDFLANVSHDLKTPLTSIQGYAQAILDGATKDPQGAAHIIHDEASRLNRMVVQLTDLLRMQSGHLSLNLVALDVSQVTGAIAERLALVARKKQVDLTWHTPPLPAVAGDGDRIAQVLTNLISNAIKFTPTGGHVRVATRPHAEGVEIIVSDDGQGIPAEDIPHIFDRFYQVDKARSPHRGTGLGLAITKEIVEAHGGRIEVMSEGLGKGTRFTVWLPSPQLRTMVMKRPSVKDG